MATRSRFGSAMFASKSTVLPRYFHDGKAEVDPYLADLMDCEEGCEVVVKKIIIYKSPLSKDLQQASAKQQGAGRPSRVHHRYLIVEVSRVQPSTRGDQLSGFLIRAEKFGLNPQGKAGIKVTHVASEGKAAEEYYSKVFNLPMQIKKLIEILMAHNPEYDVLCDNCWKYADETFKALEDTLQATTGSVEVQRQGQS